VPTGVQQEGEDLEWVFLSSFLSISASLGEMPRLPHIVGFYSSFSFPFLVAPRFFLVQLLFSSSRNVSIQI